MAKDFEYRVIRDKVVDHIQDHLNAAAEDGFRLVQAVPTDLGFGIFVMEKTVTNQPPSTH
jgi:hypothetical protein